MKNVNLVLLHNNIVNKFGNLIETSITNIDVHDISRTVRTYRLNELSLVNRLESQKKILNDMLKYWIKGEGGINNPDRKKALEKVKQYNRLEDVQTSASNIKYIITDAKKHTNSILYKDMKNIISENKNTQFYLIFGTGWGLDSIITQKADYILEPVQYGSDFNHLSVRAAAAIICDRLFAF
ncbi:MAG: RNA methyltransferase [Candidatus Muiribacteriota bacterium]